MTRSSKETPRARTRARCWCIALCSLFLFGCPEKKRPSVPQDVPVQVGQNEPEPITDSSESPSPALPVSPEEATELELSTPLVLKVPGSDEKTELWFQLPVPKRPMSMQLSLSGGPDTRWGLVLHEQEVPGPELLKTHQPEPGHPFRISGIRGSPDLPTLLVKVHRIWHRKESPESQLRLFIEAALIRPGEESEPNDTRLDTAPLVPERGRLEGSLSHPNDKDCVTVPQPQMNQPSENAGADATASPANCQSVRFRFEGPSRRPFLVEGSDADGKITSSNTLRAPRDFSFLPQEADFPHTVCLEMDEGSRAPQRWWVDSKPAPCPQPVVVPEVTEEPDRNFVVSSDKPTVVSGKLQSADAEHGIVIKTTEYPALIRVEGSVSAHWNDETQRLFILPPGSEKRMVIRIDSAPMEGDAPFPYWIQLKSLPRGEIISPNKEMFELGQNRIYTTIPMPDPLEIKFPEDARGSWIVEHLGERKSPRIKVKLLDGQQRPVTSRTVGSGKSSTLKLPEGFGPYRASISQEGPSERPLSIALVPSSTEKQGSHHE